MENLTSYNVKVHTSGHTVFFRNRAVRTPVEFKNIFGNDLELLKSKLEFLSIEYSIHKVTNEEQIIKIEEDIITDNDVQIEELYPEEKKEPDSIMEKLIAENS
jgi:hypothetical protein